MANLIDLKEEFPHLSKAPIVEAALDIRVVPSVEWDETVLQRELKQLLPDYPKIEPLHRKKFQITPEKPIIEDFGCVGLKLHSVAKPHIAQFNNNAFVFSRLKPYENWQQFSEEALRLWGIYCELLKPKEVTRIGLRFINRIGIKQEKIELADYYKYPPTTPEELNWTLNYYLHHDVMKVPETSYAVNVIKTIQNIPEKTGLILDIDVFMGTCFEYNESKLTEFLEEMRWIKNKIFFSSVINKIIQELR